ncbi:imelysin [Pseudomonas sp. MAP12]|uniref:Imelysin n=1 Tax=Geopseudomonas aromaticivorans TaxID=2849492 RepID=A0ABS6N009_9GAMM|nr:imelysin family protein [Pseudomonas aromaticivorans]MBV2134371.1 imelysin [Pseudomonas aromaticivorans]
MLRPALLSLALLTALAGCSKSEPPQPKKEPFAAASAALTDAVLLPAYTRWTDSDRQLADSARAFCSGEQALPQARQAYLNAFGAWAALQPLAIGPLGEGNLSWQVQFWPDKKNLVARQVDALLASKPQLKQADLESASVVVQGLTAYEYLLFDQGIDLADLKQKRRYCPLLLAIGTHQQALSAKVLGAWLGEQGLANQLKNIPNSRYAEGREALGELLRAQVNALEGLKKKLGTPLARGTKAIPQPYQAEAWRSGASLASLDASLATAETLWRGQANGDGAGVRSLLGKDQADLATRIDAAYAESRQRIAALGQPLTALLADEAGRTSLNQLYDSLDTLHRLHGNDLAKALGIQLGFNAHDGD